MYKKIKKVFNLRNLVYIISSFIVLFAIIWFLFVENYSFFISGFYSELSGEWVNGYIRDFKGFEIISFNANFYYKALPIVFNIFSILLFVSLLFVFINTIVKIFKRSNIGKLLKYISAGFC